MTEQNLKAGTKNFTFDEFKCPCCGRKIVKGLLIATLQKLRDIINKPVIISSGYRCLQYNKSIGGYRHSPHLTGEAADIKIKGMSTITIAMIASHIPYIRLGLYPSHLHIDIRPCNPSKYWLVKKYGGKYIYSGKEKSLAKFLKDNL